MTDHITAQESLILMEKYDKERMDVDFSDSLISVLTILIFSGISWVLLS